MKTTAKHMKAKFKKEENEFKELKYKDFYIITTLNKQNNLYNGTILKEFNPKHAQFIADENNEDVNEWTFSTMQSFFQYEIEEELTQDAINHIKEEEEKK